MNSEKLDNYIYNAIIMSTDRTLPLEFSRILRDTITKYGFDESDLSNRLKITLKQYSTDDFYKDYLLKTGYIKRLNTSPETFILTTKGIRVQNAGGLSEYFKKQKIKNFFKFLKKLIVYLITPLIAIISTFYPIFKKDKPIEIKQPINIHLSQDSTLNNNKTIITKSK